MAVMIDSQQILILKLIPVKMRRSFNERSHKVIPVSTACIFHCEVELDQLLLRNSILSADYILPGISCVSLDINCALQKLP